MNAFTFLARRLQKADLNAKNARANGTQHKQSNEGENIMTTQEIKIYETVKREGQYIETAINTEKERKALYHLAKQGVLKVSKQTPETRTFIRNWK